MLSVSRCSWESESASYLESISVSSMFCRGRCSWEMKSVGVCAGECSVKVRGECVSGAE